MKKMSALGGFAILLSVCASSAGAQIYMCKDASGRTLTSDRPIPECADRPMREMGKNGVVRRVIAAPLTPEEKRQKQAEEEKKKADAVAAEEKRKADRALMARYNSEKALEDARRRALDISEDAIKREKLSIEVTEKQLAQWQSEADGLQKKKARIPANLQGRIDDATRSIEDSRKVILERQDEMKQTNTRFDENLKRYREIHGTANETASAASSTTTATK